MACSSYGWFQGQGRMKYKQEFVWLEPLTLWFLGSCSDNLSCLNLYVRSHLVCQHLNWLLLLKLAQRITSSLAFILSLHVPPCTRILLDLTWRKYKVQCVFCSCPKGKPKSRSIGTDLQCLPWYCSSAYTIYAQGCRKPPLCSCF